VSAILLHCEINKPKSGRSDDDDAALAGILMSLPLQQGHRHQTHAPDACGLWQKNNRIIYGKGYERMVEESRSLFASQSIISNDPQ